MSKSEDMNLATQLRAEMKSMSAELCAEIQTSAAGLRSEMSAFKTDLLKWMVFFAVTQALATALLLKFHR
jgi:hypothetical protein